MLPLAMSASPIEGFESKKNILSTRKNKTIKKEPFETKKESSLENLENTVNKIKSIHSQQEDSPELASFMNTYEQSTYENEPLPPPKMVNNFPDSSLDSRDENITHGILETNPSPDYALIEGNYANTANTSEKYYSAMKNSYNPHNVATKDELLQKLDHLIHLFEAQKDMKSGSVTEELILYSFLGIFIIYVLDSFVKVGKYTR